MKVQELLPGSKPSPSPRASRGARAEDRPSDFAGALTEARKKPEPRPAEPEAPVAKKPAASRKGKAAKDDAEPAAADDAVAPETSDAIEDPEAPLAEGEQTPVDEQARVAEVEGESPEDVAEGQVDPASIALAQVAQQPVAVAAEDATADADAEPAATAPRMICPPTMRRPARPEATDSDGQDVKEIAGVSAGVAETIVQELDDDAGDESGFSLERLDVGDASPEPPAATAPVKQGTPATPAAMATPAAGDAEAPKARDVADETVPPATPELTAARDTVNDASPMSMTPVAGDVQTSSSLTTTAHLQPDTAKPQAPAPAPAAPAPVPPPPQDHFVETNHPRIVTAVRGELLPHGGSMQIRLDPPELGALQVMVHMQDGVMTASFQTSNDDATRLLSHSLSHLKAVLESQGVSVEKLQVQQAPRDQQAANQNDDRQHQRDGQDDAHRQEQQRKELLRRMWRRLANGSDPLDLVA